MSIWSSIFGPKFGGASSVEIRPSGLLMDADGWYYEESLDAECPLRTIRVQQDRPGDWYVRNTNCQVAELNSPSRAAEVLGQALLVHLLQVVAHHALLEVDAEKLELLGDVRAAQGPAGIGQGPQDRTDFALCVDVHLLAFQRAMSHASRTVIARGPTACSLSHR